MPERGPLRYRAGVADQRFYFRQLLAGRDFATHDDVARQLVNFVYLIGDRQTMSLESSPHVKFTSDRTTYRIIQRNDGRPWIQSAITPKNGGPTLSPFVQVAVR